ncbi:MAG TPA: glycosyltransferase family 87 protein [Actinospica sp.]|nr:glycosyltransferase family 87 protein [Actinospica sp.]
MTRLVAEPRYRRVLAAWFVSRVLLMLMATTVLPWFSHGAVLGDVKIYHGWARILEHGSYPVHDTRWQYPPAAALIFLAPLAVSHFGASYLVVFFFLALLFDLAVLLLVLAHADRNARADGAQPHLTGVWAWVVGGFAIGPLLLMRYDVIVTALAVAGLVFPARSVRLRWSVRGALLGVGTMVKVWPGALILGLPPKGPGRRAVAWAVGTSLALTAILSLSMTGALSFLSGQSNRGIEVESVLASVFMILHWFGYPAKVAMTYGSFQVSGPGISAVASFAELLTVVGVGIVLWWRLMRFKARSWTPGLMYDTAFTVVLVLVVTSRVLSPQYLIWLLGLAALVFTENGPMRRGTVMARPATLVMFCVLITQVEFPLLFGEVMGGQFWGTMVVAVRNVILVVACVQALRRLWHAGAREPELPAGERKAAASATHTG